MERECWAQAAQHEKVQSKSAGHIAGKLSTFILFVFGTLVRDLNQE